MTKWDGSVSEKRSGQWPLGSFTCVSYVFVLWVGLGLRFGLYLYFSYFQVDSLSHKIKIIKNINFVRLGVEKYIMREGEIQMI